VLNANKKIEQYHIGDFFSFYISHQSDSLGVMPLSILSKEKDFNFINTYGDMDYSINKFIDSVIIKVDPRFLKYNEDGSKLDFDQFAKDIFITHLFDIYTSKVFTDFEYKENEDTLSVFGFNQQQHKYWKDMKQSFEERNFFGISLLSYFFAGLLKAMKKEKITIYLACNDEKNEGFNGFLKELIEYATDPEKIEFVKEKDDPMISMKLYVSNGSELENKDLHDDNFFKYTSYHSTSLKLSYHFNYIQMYNVLINI